MAISVNWGTKVITIPQADLTFVSGTTYELTVDDLWMWLHDALDSVDGMAFPDAFNRIASSTLAGITYAPQLEIINGYTIEFEDGQYTVSMIGGNHNVADVKVTNQVSLITQNSAGLIVSVQGSGVTPQDKLDIINGVDVHLDDVPEDVWSYER